MSKIVYQLPIVPLTEGYDAYVAGGGITRMFLADHNGFKRGDFVYWFDPNDGKESDFAFIDDFKVDDISEEGLSSVSFILRLRNEDSEVLKMKTASLDEIIKITGMISLGCNWLEDGEEIEDSAEVAIFAVPVGQPTLTVEDLSKEDGISTEYYTIPMWRIQGVDTVLLQNVVEIYNEHCFHYH